MINLYQNITTNFPNHDEDKFVFDANNLPKLESNVVEINE